MTWRTFHLRPAILLTKPEEHAPQMGGLKDGHKKAHKAQNVQLLCFLCLSAILPSTFTARLPLFRDVAAAQT